MYNKLCLFLLSLFCLHQKSSQLVRDVRVGISNDGQTSSDVEAVIHLATHLNVSNLSGPDRSLKHTLNITAQTKLKNEGIIIPFTGDGQLVYDMDLVNQGDDFQVAIRTFTHGSRLIRWIMTVTSYLDHEDPENQKGSVVNIRYNVLVTTELKYIQQRDMQLLLPEEISDDGFMEMRQSQTPIVDTNLPLYEFDKYFSTRCDGNACSTNLTDGDRTMTFQSGKCRVENHQSISTKFDARTVEEPLVVTEVRSFSLNIMNTMTVRTDTTVDGMDTVEFASNEKSGSAGIYINALIFGPLMFLIKRIMLSD